MLDLFEFEAVLDAEAGAVAAEPDTSGAVASGEATDTPSPETAELAVEAATPAWAPTQDDWQNLSQRLDALGQAVTPQPEKAAAPSFEDYFQRDDTGELVVDLGNLQRYIDDKTSAGIDARMQPIQPVLDQTISDRGEQVVQAKLETLGVPEAHRSVARDIAEGLVTSLGDPSAALTQAAQKVDQLVKAERAAAVEDYKTALKNVGDASRDPSAASAGVERTEPRKGMSGYDDVADSWVARVNGSLN